jgi:hypothetical protein
VGSSESDGISRRVDGWHTHAVENKEIAWLPHAFPD